MTTATEHGTRSVHIEAMKFAQKAIVAEMEGNDKKAFELNEKAFVMEREAALSYLTSTLEPTRSVLFRSAASLAMLCNRFQESKELILHGLDGNPPLAIMEELLGLHAEVTKKELDELFHQKRKELDEFMKAKTKELNETMLQARAIVENRAKATSRAGQ